MFDSLVFCFINGCAKLHTLKVCRFYKKYLGIFIKSLKANHSTMSSLNVGHYHLIDCVNHVIISTPLSNRKHIFKTTPGKGFSHSTLKFVDEKPVIQQDMWAIRFNTPLFGKYDRLYFNDDFNNDDEDEDDVVVAATVMYMYNQMNARR